MPGFGFKRGFSNSNRRVGLLGGVALPDFFVDSVAGLDTNAGTQAAPFKTISKLQTSITAKGAGSSFSLARGSYWREQLDVTVNDLTMFEPHGAGSMPVIDGADAVASGWTQPNAGLYPNVWSQSWTRTSATTTGSEVLGYWEAGARTTYRADLTALQAGSNGDWHTTNLTTQASTVSIRSAADPNSDGILREFTRRHYGINGHAQIVGANRTGVPTEGPIEIKRCVGHYNAYTGPRDGTAKKFFLRDGNIHHVVTEGLLTQDAICTEMSPEILGVPYTAYRAVGTGFQHTFERCLALFGGGASRRNIDMFYGHGSTPTTIDRMTLESCMSKGGDLASADTALLEVSNCYAEDVYEIGVDLIGTNNTVTRLLLHDTTQTPKSGGNRPFRKLSTIRTATISNSATFTRLGFAVESASGGVITINNCALITRGGNGISNGRPVLNYNVCLNAGRSLVLLETGYTGDFNVYHFEGQAFASFQWNATLYGSLGALQAASGQETNSVFLKAVDQTASNPNAFWLGVSTGANLGAESGDFRINPNARVYNGAGAALTGTFADGVTPITAAGPQTHWDFNTRAVVAGPPTRRPTLPVTIAEMRSYVDDPEAWNFYP